MIATLRAALMAVAVMAAADAARAETTYRILSFDQLDGWDKDDHRSALSVFLNTCTDFNDPDEPDWSSLCALAHTERPENARAFFELFFRPVLVEDGADPLFTG